MYGKQEDRDDSVREFTDYCNDNLRDQSKQGDKYFLFRKSEDMFYVKRDCANHEHTPEDDLEELTMFCEHLLEAAEEAMEGCDNREKKAIREIVAKRLGSSGGALEQYQDLFLNIARHLIP